MRDADIDGDNRRDPAVSGETTSQRPSDATMSPMWSLFNSVQEMPGLLRGTWDAIHAH